jgi:exopolyphosphatase/guanosine-5'-triphosphate,3'-diphosphate pyrophosphatase
MVYIGTGNIGISVLEGGRMPFLQNVKVGPLRMGELFEDLEEYTSDVHRLIEEYLNSFINVLADDIPGDTRHFIASGREIGLIAELTGVDAGASVSSFINIPRESLFALYDDIKHKTSGQVAADYGIDGERADMLLPSACIFQNLLRHTAAPHITAARMLPGDAVLYEMLYPKVFAALNKAHSKNTLLSATALARRYNAREAHWSKVYGFAMTIFDKMKRIHGLGARDKLLLSAAAILHDVGKYINNREHYRHSFAIIQGSDIVGLSQAETEIVAYICLYHARQAPSGREPLFAQLSVESRMRVSKLAAILRLADALDRSHLGKFSEISVKITGGALVITVAADTNTSLEQWSFNEKGKFFEEVFGIKAVIKVKRP